MVAALILYKMYCLVSIGTPHIVRRTPSFIEAAWRVQNMTTTMLHHNSMRAHVYMGMGCALIQPTYYSMCTAAGAQEMPNKDYLYMYINLRLHNRFISTIYVVHVAA